jgi:hypothetical protein
VQHADKAATNGKNWMRVFVAEMEKLSAPLLNGVTDHAGG